MAQAVKKLPANPGGARDAGSIPGLAGFPWRRKWQPTPVFLPEKPHRQRSLVGCSLRGRKESDTTERLNWTELNILGTGLGIRGFPSGSVVTTPLAKAGDARDADSTPGLNWQASWSKWQPTPVFLPEKSYGQRSLVGYTVHEVAKDSEMTQRQHMRVHGLGMRDTAEAREK